MTTIFNTVKQILPALALMLAAGTLGAKNAPGIPPVDTPQAAAESAAAWTAPAPGAALQELQQRTPGVGRQTLVQPDGIVDFRPEALTGIPSTANAAQKVAALPKARIPGGSNVVGTVGVNNLDLPVGIYRLPLKATQKHTLLRDISESTYTFHAGAASDNYYLISYYGRTLENGQYLCVSAIFDTSDWSLTGESGGYGQYQRVASDMTYDATLGRFYGCFLSADQSRWVLAYMAHSDDSPLSTLAKVIEIAPLEVSLNGIAADAGGTLWGIRNDNGDLVTVNKKTGALTTVASTGFVPGYNGSLTWDKVNNLLYWSVIYADNAGGMASALLTVAPATGALAHAYDYERPAQVMGLATEFTAPAATPGVFGNLVADFEGENLSGTVTFDAPDALTDGTAASGPLTYLLTAVKDNGYKAVNSTLTCSYGEKGVKVPVTLNTAGNYTFTVAGVNDAGTGYPVSVSRYVGPDMPNSVQGLKLERSSGKVTATWEADPGTQHGGYFDPDKVKFLATLQQADANGSIVEHATLEVSDGKAEWSVEDSETLAGFSASVVPVFDTKQGEAATTGWQWLGHLSAPFVQTMSAAVDGWTTATASGSPWQKYSDADGSGWAVPYIWGTTNNTWLFSPAIRLEAGRYYAFSFKTWSSIVKHTIKIWLGSGASAELMATKLGEYTLPDHSEKVNTVTYGFLCPATGIYYLGIHNDTKSDTYTNKPYMWVNDVTCQSAPDEAPAAPGLVVDYDRSGALEAAITVAAPDKTFGGDAITATLDAVTITINGADLQTWENVEPGTALTLDYTAAKAGEFTFTAYATKSGIDGVTEINHTYLGIQKPQNPEWVTMVETDTPGTVEVTWADVHLAENGQEIDPVNITYNVMNIIDNAYLAQTVTEQPFIYKVCDPDKQKSVYISVNAQTSAGKSSTYGTYAGTGITHVGKPYSLPVHETFEGGYAHYSWTIVNQHSASDGFSAVSTSAVLGDRDANGDGYCLRGFVPYVNSQASLYSGVIDVPADPYNPVLGFAIYRPYYGENDQNDNTIVVSIMGDKTQGSVPALRTGDQPYGWKYYYYDMSTFKGQKVNLLFTCQTRSYNSHYIDDIQFFDAPAADVALAALTVPATVVPGQRFNISATVTNKSVNELPRRKATVQLYRNGGAEPIATADVSALSMFQSTTVAFTDELNSSYDAQVTYEARVVFEGDMVADNNSATATATVVHPTLPAPTALTGGRGEGGFASLQWTAPDMSPVFPADEIDFESCKAASGADMCGFTTFDVDGNEVSTELGISGPQGFTSFPHTQLARSGMWMLVSPCNADGAAKEDWLVSPRLSGHAQTISFYVRTNWNAYETFSLLTSTTGAERADFTDEVLTMTTRSNDWQAVDVEVPEGTLHFAIVCKAEDTSNLIYLMLDDFTFERADINAGLELSAYRAYRDNAMIEEIEPVESWDDLTGNPGPHFYRVTAVYGADGESAPSEELYLFTRGTGIEDAAATLGRIYTEAGRIVVEGADGSTVSVSDLSGICLESVAGAPATTCFSVAPGVYIVTIDSRSVKVLVK